MRAAVSLIIIVVLRYIGYNKFVKDYSIKQVGVRLTSFNVGMETVFTPAGIVMVWMTAAIIQMRMVVVCSYFKFQCTSNNLITCCFLSS